MISSIYNRVNTFVASRMTIRPHVGRLGRSAIVNSESKKKPSGNHSLQNLISSTCVGRHPIYIKKGSLSAFVSEEQKGHGKIGQKVFRLHEGSNLGSQKELPRLDSRAAR